MKPRSRLSRRLENQTKKSFIISIIGIIILAVFVLKFGLPLLINFTLLISGSKNAPESTNEKNAFIPQPILNALPSATNSAHTNISGTSITKQTVNLYINGELVDKVAVDKDGNYVFKDVKLSTGVNTIRAKASIDSKKESDFSNEIDIIYKNSEPNLSVSSPEDNKSFSKDENPITITGKTDPGARVTINNFWAIVKENGDFSYSLSLQNGENQIKIVATDEAGNKKEITKKVTYNP